MPYTRIEHAREQMSEALSFQLVLRRCHEGRPIRDEQSREAQLSPDGGLLPQVETDAQEMWEQAKSMPFLWTLVTSTLPDGRLRLYASERYVTFYRDRDNRISSTGDSRRHLEKILPAGMEIQHLAEEVAAVAARVELENERATSREDCYGKSWSEEEMERETRAELVGNTQELAAILTESLRARGFSVSNY